MSVDRVLIWMVIVAAALFLIHAIPLAILMFIYRRELDFKYVLFGIRAERCEGDSNAV